MTISFVSNSAINGMAVSLAIAVLFPIFLLLFWKITERPKLVSFFVGAAAFFVFALILEQLFHTLVMTVVGGGDLLAGNAKMTSNIWIYGLYGGVCAAIFEETARFIAMKFCMKNFLDKKNAIMYGIGHGGIEAIITVGLLELSNIAMSVAINSGSIEETFNALPKEQKMTVLSQMVALTETPAYQFYLAGVERVFAVLAHIIMSYFVFRFIKYKEKKNFYIALGIHFSIDCGLVILASYTSTIVAEVVLAVAVISLLVWVVRLYKNDKDIVEVPKTNEQVNVVE